MSEENERRVAAMTEEEREQERRQNREKLKNIGGVVRKARMAREVHEKQEKTVVSLKGDGTVPPSILPVQYTLHPRVRQALFHSCCTLSQHSTNHIRASFPSPILSSSRTWPPTPMRANRKLRKPLALIPPSGDDITVSLGHLSSTSPIASDGPPEKGTPEDIRRRFFPSFPAGGPSLTWIESTPLPDPTATALRFDLHGAPIPPELSISLPTHLGLHHHSEGARAGYAFDDVSLLTRSTVPAQRVAMLGVVAGIVRRIVGMPQGISKDAEGMGMEELRGKEEQVRKRAIAAGADAMTERGSLGSRAVEVLWEALVRWDEELMDSNGVELILPRFP
ncbi:RPAP1-like protein [Russula emetica]|nr:RPAP1-like protein [Russula emetica]